MLTVGALFVTWRTIGVLRDQTSAAVVNAKAALKQVEAMDRAWLKHEVTIARPFKQTGDKRHIDLKILVKCANVGCSPATNVHVNARLCPVPSWADNSEPIRTLEQMLETPMEMGEGQVVFPHDEMHVDFGIGAHAPARSDGHAAVVKMPPDYIAQIPSDSGMLSPDAYRLYIVGAITYRFDGSESTHHSTSVFEILRDEHDALKPFSLPFGVGQTEVQAEHLTLRRGIMGFRSN